MADLTLVRYERSNHYTLGALVAKGSIFYTIERPWLGNKKGVSCIPSGEYKFNYLARSGSGKYRNVFHVVGVRGRSGILIHNGNLASHSRGCIIIGSSTGALGGKRAVLGSRSALRKLNKLLNKSGGTIKIT